MFNYEVLRKIVILDHEKYLSISLFSIKTIFIVKKKRSRRSLFFIMCIFQRFLIVNDNLDLIQK